ncbi:MAG: hypothetical protein KKD17_06775 [Nanoarchaeota archaeon]|nr:hypothetical protein [Nanoarchaeota archaeon]
MFADYLVQTICDVLGVDFPSEDEPKIPKREPENKHSHLFIPVDWYRSARDSFYRWLEKPRDPLAPEQLEALRDLEQRVDGLHFHPDKLSLQRRTAPVLLYAGFGNMPYLGTAYGSRFDSLEWARKDAVLSDVIRQIEEAAYD